MPFAGTDPSSNSWSAHCPFTKEIGKIDPIVYFNNQPHPPTHVHLFFGNVLADGVTPTTTPQQLRDASLVQGEYTTCLGPKLASVPPGSCTTASHMLCDKSAYWVPQLEDTSVRDPGDPASPDGWAPILPAYVLVYYRNEEVDPKTIEGFDPDLGIVAGSAMAMQPQDPWIVAWSCVQARQQTNVGVLMPKSCTIGHVEAGENPDVYLRMVVTFPNCLSRDVAHIHGIAVPTSSQVAYTTDPANHGTCPAGLVPIPTIQVGARWDLSAHLRNHLTGKTFTLSSLYLSSDFMGDPKRSHGTWVARGQSAHADFESGWSQPELDELMHECFDSGPRNCGFVKGGGT